MRKWVALVAVLLAVSGGIGAAWWQLDRREDRQYRRFCIEKFTDQGRCERGPAAEPRKKCLRGEWPPGIPRAGSLAACVQAWLAQEQ